MSDEENTTTEAFKKLTLHQEIRFRKRQAYLNFTDYVTDGKRSIDHALAMIHNPFMDFTKLTRINGKISLLRIDNNHLGSEDRQKLEELQVKELDSDDEDLVENHKDSIFKNFEDLTKKLDEYKAEIK